MGEGGTADGPLGSKGARPSGSWLTDVCFHSYFARISHGQLEKTCFKIFVMIFKCKSVTIYMIREIAKMCKSYT